MTKYKQDYIKNLLKVYFIMGSNNSELDPEYVLTEALKAGITIFQFREKGAGSLTGSEKTALARKLQNKCKEYNVPFIVNDDVDLALQIGADGVHIGQEDEKAEAVKKKIGNKIVGVSAHTVEEVKSAIKAGADYVGIGPIFPTKTKKDTEPVQGTRLLKELQKNKIQVPIVGIGGITNDNAGEVICAGADGVAVISEVSMAAYPFESAKNLVETVAAEKIKSAKSQ
ncbi:thiamine phosphate synthase [Niallia sp. 03190]|uniref:thiamine phosphate synthase n=1 Tax=Niallia sp. 03190 TaxID=3458061 RepID=UPI004043F561